MCDALSKKRTRHFECSSAVACMQWIIKNKGFARMWARYDAWLFLAQQIWTFLWFNICLFLMIFRSLHQHQQSPQHHWVKVRPQSLPRSLSGSFYFPRFFIACFHIMADVAFPTKLVYFSLLFICIMRWLRFCIFIFCFLNENKCVLFSEFILP